VAQGDAAVGQEGGIAGLPGAIFDDGHRVEAYMRNATVVIFGANPGQIRPAAAQLKKSAKATGAVEMPCTAPAGTAAG
jgi:hypothetical protein